LQQSYRITLNVRAGDLVRWSRFQDQKLEFSAGMVEPAKF